MTDKNKSTATATAPNTATETKEKAKPGSSIAARSKAAISEVFNDLKNGLTALSEHFEKPLKLADVLTPEVAKRLEALYEEISTTAARGVPLEQRLANTEAEITAHWPTMDVDKATGKPSVEWQEKAQLLMNRKSSIIRLIKKRDEEKAAKDSTTSTDKGASATN